MFRIVYVIFLFFSSCGVCAQSQKHRTECYLGVMKAQLVERVYDSYDERMLSELLWNLGPVGFIGLKHSSTLPYSVRLELDFKLPLDGKKGTMTNTDWMSDDHPSLWTDRSFANVSLIDGLACQAKVLAPLSRSPFSLCFGYQWQRWHVRNHFLNSVGSSAPDFGFIRDEFEVGDGETTIELMQTAYAPFIGLEGLWEGESLALKSYFYYAPKVEAKSRDLHLYSVASRFDDRGTGGPLHTFGLEVDYLHSPAWRTGLCFEMQRLNEVRANTLLDDGSYYENSAGIAYSTMSLSMKVSRSF